MQRFRAEGAKYAYSSDHASLGTVQPGEPFEVECVEGFGNSFSSPDDFTPERYASARRLAVSRIDRVALPIDAVAPDTALTSARSLNGS
jgi:hypothetical protein